MKIGEATQIGCHLIFVDKQIGKRSISVSHSDRLKYEILMGIEAGVERLKNELVQAELKDIALGLLFVAIPRDDLELATLKAVMKSWKTP